MQHNIKIGIYEIPVVDINDAIYYPLSTINKVIYLRDGLSLAQRKPYEEYCKFENVKYETATNKTNVISHEGLIEFVKNRKIGTFNLEQKKNHNMLCEYLGLDKIDEIEKVIDKLPYNPKEYYNEYEVGLYSQSVNISKYALCDHCNKYYPINELFFNKDHRTKHGYQITACKRCFNGNFKGEIKFKIMNEVKELDVIEQVEKMINKKDAVYNDWYTKENVYSFVNELKIRQEITYDNFSKLKYDEVINKYKLNSYSIKSILTYFDATIELFGIDFYCKPYKYYRPLKRDLWTFDIQKKIFNNYLIDNNITIEDPLSFNYGYIINNAKINISSYYKNGVLDRLEFVDKYNDYKYPAYKYTTPATKYWTIKENRNRALKELINEMGLSNINKLPLYLTKYTLATTSRTMYNVYKKFYDNLFDWVDECYPNIFEFSDFNGNIQRNEFDSLEEKQVHNILIEKFGKDLIYNLGDASNRFSINGKYQPDWIVLSEKPIIIEYFGMYVKNSITKTTVVKHYNDKINYKIEFYDKLKNYNKLYIYPDDLKNNFYGLKCKLDKII